MSRTVGNLHEHEFLYAGGFLIGGDGIKWRNQLQQRRRRIDGFDRGLDERRCQLIR